MILNMLFFTIIIKRKNITAEEFKHREEMKKLREEYIVRGLMHRN
ncbi:YrzI family small protein [Peribacillus sp. B-H-3]|jgi:uncharacterized protein (TIGR02413 family)